MTTEYRNIGQMLDTRAAENGEWVYLSFYGRTMTYARFNEAANRFANALLSLGVKKGDIVYVHASNRPEQLIACLGAVKVGAVAGPINIQLTAPEVEYELNDSKGTVLVTESELRPVVEAMAPRLSHITHIIEIGEIGDSVGEGHLSFQGIVEKGSASPPGVPVGLNDLAFIFYTSGTTGKPKGALLTHGNVLNTMEGLRRALEPPGGDTGEQRCALIFLPLFHVNAMMSLVSAINRGLKVALLKKFSVREFGPTVEKDRCEFFSAVPKVYKILLEARETVKQNDLSSLKFAVCGAAPMPVETIREFEAVYGVEILEGYGLTEATVASTLHRRGGKKKIGSIGVPLDGQEVRIMGPDRRLLPPGETGEIVVRGPSVMVGYFGKDQETQKTITDGWLHTGDVGRMDEDGFFYIVDREKDMIIKGGENIYPKEVEDVIHRHPAVHDVAVIGVPDRVSGEEVKAFVVLRLGRTATEVEIIAHCRTQLAEFKVPTHIEFVLGIPTSVIGKSLKRKLRDGEGIVRMAEETEELALDTIFQMMPYRINKEKAGRWRTTIQYEIYGKNKGTWVLTVRDGAGSIASGPPSVPPVAVVRMYDTVFKMMIGGKIDGITAINSGLMQIEGSEADVAMLSEVMG